MHIFAYILMARILTVKCYYVYLLNGGYVVSIFLPIIVCFTNVVTPHNKCVIHLTPCDKVFFLMINTISMIMIQIFERINTLIYFKKIND